MNLGDPITWAVIAGAVAALGCLLMGGWLAAWATYQLVARRRRAREREGLLS